MNVIDALEWRYATKKFDSSKVLEKEKLETILRAANLAPTSSGLQPFHIVLVSGEKAKKTILPIFKNQLQIFECSHLLVFAAWDNYTTERIKGYVDSIKKVRGEDSQQLRGYMERIESLYTNRSQEINFNHAIRQAYISLGFCLETAALLQVDSAPIENFDSGKLDKALGLDRRNLRSVVALCLGYRDKENDWLVDLPKVRKDLSEFVIRME